MSHFLFPSLYVFTFDCPPSITLRLSPIKSFKLDMQEILFPAQMGTSGASSAKYLGTQLHNEAMLCRVASNRQFDISYLEEN